MTSSMPLGLSRGWQGGTNEPVSDQEDKRLHMAAASKQGATWSRRAALATLLGAASVGCSAPRHLVGVTSQSPDAQPSTGGRTHRIFIATTRAPSADPKEFFSGNRSMNLNFATVDVHIPPVHRAGSVERPRSLPPNPEEHFVIFNPQTLTNTAFRAEAEDQVRGRSWSQRKILLWVHGYNTTLSDAVLRLAQFVEDTGYDGVPVLFSWASGGRVTSYVYDINSALIARDSILEVAKALGRSSFATIDVLAHSMGNFVTMEAIRGASRQGLYDTTGKLATIILADPDIDYELFVAQLRKIPPENRRFYVLISKDDRALGLSTFLARRPRVGNIDAERLTRLGVTVIDLSEVSDTSSINHTKFVDSPEVVRLLGNRLLAGDTYSERTGSRLGETIIVGATGAVSVIE